MRRIMAFCLVVLALLIITACTEEQSPAPPTATVTPPAAEPVKQVAEEVTQKVVETIAEVKAEATDRVEDAKDQVVDVVEQAKTSVADVVEAVPKFSVPSMKTVTPESKGPDLVSYDATQGKVTFNHTEHSGRFDCSACHTTDPPQKIVIDKEVGHDLCKGCHKGVSNAPKSCSGCHLK